MFAVFADILLFNAHNYKIFLQGQFLLGTAAGIYWPAAELAVPINCGKYPSSKGFALVRTADALGISIGSIIGTISSWFSSIRIIYLVDILCMLMLILVLSNKSLKEKSKAKLLIKEINESDKNKDYIGKLNKNKEWISSLLPILLISLFATSILSLLQSGLPLDLIKGGVNRPPLNETTSGFILAIQLALLLIFQWPVGRWLSQKDVDYGLRISLIFLGSGCLFLSLSNKLYYGIIFIIIALILIAIGLTSFLPTATEGITRVSNLSNRGLAMALFSQCFGISSIIAPIASGQIIDRLGNALLLWLLMAFIAIACLPLTKKVRVYKLNKN